MYKPTAKEITTIGEEDKFYWLLVFCSNCNLNKSLAFRKGDRVEDHSCPNCDNRTLHISRGL